MAIYTNACLLSHGSKWRGMLQYKDPTTGKWRKKSKVLKSTGKRAAQKELEEWRAEEEEKAQAEAAAGPHAAKTVNEYVTVYIEGKKPQVEPSTYREYRRLQAKLIEPTLGNVLLAELNPDAVRAWIAALSEEYAPSTCKKGLTLLRSCMSQAIDNDILSKDPTRGVKPPRGGRPRPNALDLDGIKTLLSVIDVAGLTPATLGIEIALFTGLRKGEICALRWKDIDLENHALTVESAIGRGEEGFYIKAPKTGESARTVYYSDLLANALEQRLEEVKAAFVGAGIPFNRECFVLGGIDGSYLSTNALGKRWEAMAEALELKGTRGTRPTFHDLRHTYATQAIAAGIDVKAVSAQLGHSNAAMTLNTYADATKQQKQNAARIMGERLGGLLE